MVDIKQAGPTVPANLQKAVDTAHQRGLLTDEGVKALTDGDISRADKQLAGNILDQAFDRAGAAGAAKDKGALGPAVKDAEAAKRLADATVGQFYKENPSFGASTLSKLGSFIDQQTLNLHRVTLGNL